jgi:hypothetical protein
MSWKDIVPEEIAIGQAAWERRHAMLRAHHAGATLAVISANVGLSRGRVGHIVQQAQREVDLGSRSPIEIFMDQKPAIELHRYVHRTNNKVTRRRREFHVGLRDRP